MTSAASSQSPDPRLDLDSTLHRWGAPIIQGSRWVGCRLDDTGPWCVAPVRRQPAAPPPDGVERRSRERITLELAGIIMGILVLPPWVIPPPPPYLLSPVTLVPPLSFVVHLIPNPTSHDTVSICTSTRPMYMTVNQ